MHPLTTQLDCHVLQSLACQVYASRFFDNAVQDTDHDVQTRRGILRAFQKTVMDNFHDVLCMSAQIDDDFLYDDDPDIVDTYKIYKEFKTQFPKYDVISMIPMTIGGSVAFVVHDTNPPVPFGSRVINPPQ